MIWAAALTALLVQPSDALPIPPDPLSANMFATKGKIQALEVCLSVNAKRMAMSSRETADVIADASFGECSSAQEAFRASLAAAQEADGSPLFELKQVNDLVSNFRATWRPKIEAFVIDTRASTRRKKR